MWVGKQTVIGTIMPGLSSVKPTVTLSKQAKLRLAWVDYYKTHNNNARLTCRHYGIAHRTFYRYYRRFSVEGAVGLETRSHRPDHVRQPLTPLPVLDIVRRLRKANPELSKYKLSIILRRDYGYNLSASSVGRIISRYRLFYPVPGKAKSHPLRRAQILRRRKPKDLSPNGPGQLVEVDVKHLPSIGAKRYGFVAIDVVSKQATVHVATTISAHQATIAWQKAVARLGLPRAVVTDNGSENLGAFADLLASQPLEHYFARPHTPKDKPYVERFIGSLERECLQWGGMAIDVDDQQELIDAWLAKYHSYRPHQALNYLTPDEYTATLRDKKVALII